MLPPDCLLDAVYDAELSVLWVLDLIKYGTFFVECEADMRSVNPHDERCCLII